MMSKKFSLLTREAFHRIIKLEEARPIIALIGLVFVSALITPHFFTVKNFKTIMASMAIVATAALGEALVILMGSIDLSILLGNTGTVDLTVNSITVGEEVIELPVEGMQGKNKIVAGERSAMEIPLKGTYEIGKAYDISIKTDPPATYIPIQITAVYRE